MAGTAVTQMPTVGINGEESSNATFDPSKVNAFRISAVIDRLIIHTRSNASDNVVEFINLCLSLARGIDFAIANHEVPSRVQELPSLLSQVCGSKTNAFLQSAIMVLMISVKNACQCGWFTNKDSDALINLAKEIASNFCSSSNFDMKETYSLSVTSTIMSRFYPRMRMGHKLVFLEVKLGFDAYVSGFHISKNLKPSSGQKIRLFVVQTDDITTSSCLTSPSKVNFLLNGKGVERRTTVSMDTGPQIPTDVTHMLKYGSNLLQAVGEFEGNYTIALAFMSETPNPGNNALQDYEQQTLATADSDAEIIEGSSRISLNCPISFKRIKTPVKGHSCKHIQCFDFDNYVSMNSRRPSWRCPHCNQYVCFTEIRIDRKMVEILEEVGTNVTEVVVASDGSWNAVMETDNTTHKSVDKISIIGQDESSLQAECDGFSNAPVDILDLTLIDDPIDSVIALETEDKKLSPTSLQRQFVTKTSTTTINSQMPGTNDANQTSGGIEDDFWSTMFFSTFGQASSNLGSNEQIGGNSATTSNNITSPSILPDPIACPNQEVEAFCGNTHVNSVTQNETSLSNTMPFPHYQQRNSTINNDYAGFASISSHLTRIPNAVQALPAQTPSSVLQKRPRDGVNLFVQSGPSAASQASSPVQMVSNTSQSRANPFHVSLSQQSSSLNQHIGLQRNLSFPSLRPSQPTVPVQAQTAYRASNDRRSSTPPHLVSPRMQSSIPSLANFSRSRSNLGVSRNGTNLSAGAVSGQQTHMMVDANRNVQMTRPIVTSRAAPSFAMPTSNHTIPSTGHQRSNSEVSSPQVTATTAVNSAQQNWRPAARMRGALSGQAYTDALNQYIIRPSQQAQAARPLNPASVSSISSKLQAFMADKTAPHPSAEPVSGPGVSDGILPEGSSGMN